MKRAILVTAFLVWMLPAQSQTKLYITLTDGSVDSLVLSQVKSISFRGSSAVSTTIVGTWDWSADAYKNGTIVISQENPLVGYFYYYGVRYNLTGSYDATGAHITCFSGTRTVISATVSKDMRTMSGTVTEPMTNISFPQSYPFAATKR
jgi:hypothetical protein